MKLPQTYNAIVISSAGAFNSAIREYLPENTFPSPVFTEDLEEAKRLLFSGHLDILIINPPINGDTCLELAKEASTLESTAVLFCVKDALYPGFKEALIPYGILTLMRPASEKTIRQTIDHLCALRERLRRSERKVVRVEEKMAEIRLVNRAKWHLIETQKMSEDEAHRYIEKTSMNLSMKKTDFCQRLIGEGIEKARP